ncbi:class I SAM-dependent methyltransferase [Methylophaga sp. OBS3]|uniref:class I SAM-dependent methyltransferase n=1 Tax=Methylophaga sp. OBS3 TaxID=2991934 RepID=UPI0022583D78|nr:class I SAM-dependent methyltransferase [Methylophaga sp. OBS3]
MSWPTADFQARAETLANNLNLSSSQQSDAPLQLLVDDNGLSLWAPSLGGPIQVDFISGKNAHRRQFGGGRGQPLAKAIGLKSGHTPTVIDATAGWARDAFVLASLGCSITMIEQQPILAALIDDGIARAIGHEETSTIAARMAVKHANAVDYLTSLDETNWPDVIYLDPMYPSRDKSALVKKDMQLLHQLVGHDQTGEALLTIALQRANKRVVVKRPKGAPLLSTKKPVAEVASKNTRYDIYAPVRA